MEEKIGILKEHPNGQLTVNLFSPRAQKKKKESAVKVNRVAQTSIRLESEQVNNQEEIDEERKAGGKWTYYMYPKTRQDEQDRTRLNKIEQD